MTESDQRFTASRRRVLLAGAAALGGGVAPVLLGGTARADDVDLAREQDARGWSTSAAGDATSQNGWPIPDGDVRSSIGVQSFTVPGTSVVLPLKSGDVAVVLLWVAAQVDSLVEPLGRSCWGYSYRAIAGTGVWSNHASGTAIDLNSDEHPQGATGTFSATQVARLREVLDVCRGTVRWGGDYRVTKDEMHFEIDVAPGSSVLAQVADELRGGATSGAPSAGVLITPGRAAAIAAGTGALSVRQGALGAESVVQTTRVARAALTDDRVAVVSTAGVCSAKQGSLYSTWTTVHDDAAGVAMSGDRLAVLTRGGDVVAKAGGLDSGWTLLLDGGADRVVLSGDRVGVLAGGRALVKEGGLGAPWVLLADGVSDLALAGDRVAVVRDGDALVKEGGLTAGWTLVARGVDRAVLGGGRVGVVSDGDAYVKDGVFGAWVLFASGGVTRLALTDGRAGVVEDGVAKVKQGGLTGSWTVLGA